MRRSGMTTWAQAFREQSLSDFHAGQALLGISGCHSQATMLLLMAWEKLAKSVLGEPTSPPSHRVAAKFIASLQADVKRVAVAWKTSIRSAHSRLQHLKLDLLQLEDLTPTWDSTHENTEYPWKQASDIRWPAQDLRRDYTLPTLPSFRLWRDFQALENALPRLI